MADGQLGSAMTLEQLQKRNSAGKPGKPKVEFPTLHIRPEAEAVPALRIRFWIPRYQRKPGSAELHFARALLQLHEFPAEDRKNWGEWSSDRAEPTDEELAAAIDSMEQVFDELHTMALCEGVRGDHRIRDLRGAAIYSYPLHDVQDSRELIRVLRLKIRHHLQRREFDEAFAAITDGHHLAAFVGQGETIIHKLVGIAEASLMRDGIEQAIQTPGCPNLYWALATLPDPLVPMGEAIDWDINVIRRVLPVLDEAVSATWTEAEALSRWAEAFDEFKMLIEDGIVDNKIQVAITVASLTSVGPARERLLAAGLPRERVAGMPAIQAAMADGAIQLRRVGDDLLKGHLLPAPLSKAIVERATADFNQWVQRNRYTAVAAVISGILLPAGHQAREAETRMVMWQHRLMTIEAIRMHAEQHGGRFPESLCGSQPHPGDARSIHRSALRISAGDPRWRTGGRVEIRDT